LGKKRAKKGGGGRKDYDREKKKDKNLGEDSWGDGGERNLESEEVTASGEGKPTEPKGRLITGVFFFTGRTRRKKGARESKLILLGEIN